VRAALQGLRGAAGDPYEGAALRFVNPVTGGSVFPTLDYRAQLLRPGEATRWKRETASTLYTVLEGEGATEVAGRRLEWARNDILVVPNFLWRRHFNTGSADAVLYAVSDAPLLDKIGQYRAQGRTEADEVLEIAG
jgi:gentisate 1,2-dioxygenase